MRSGGGRSGGRSGVRSGGEGAEEERGERGGRGEDRGGVGGAEDFGCVTMKFTLFTHPKADCNILINPHVDN